MKTAVRPAPKTATAPLDLGSLGLDLGGISAALPAMRSPTLQSYGDGAWSASLPREKAAAAIRGFVLLTVVIMARFGSPAPLPSLDWLFAAAAAYVLITTFLPAAGGAGLAAIGLPAQRLALIFSVCDIGFITALVHYTGGVGSEYYLLYYLPILNAAVRLDFRDGVGASVLAAACYVFVAVEGISGGAAPPNMVPRIFIFGISSTLLGVFFAYLSREARTYQQLSQWYRQANEEKTAFVSDASHELRTPLTAIMGFSDLLSCQELAPDRQQEYLKIIKSQAERLARLIEDILEMSRLEAGRIKLTLAPVRLEEAVGRAIKNLGLQEDRVRVSISPHLPSAEADPKRLEQMVGILLENAAHCSAEGPVEVSAWQEDGPGDTAASRAGSLGLEVKDEGPAFPPEDLPHIFKMFYLPSDPSRRHGSGLGLAIIQGLAKLHKGEISVENGAGGGVAFRLHLPVWPEGQEALGNSH